MKIYTNKFDCNNPTSKHIWTPQFSDIGIGIKVERNGSAVELSDISLVDGATTLSAELSAIDGYKIYKTSTAATSDKVYDVKVNDIKKFELIHTTTDSTVFETDEKGSGGSTPSTDGIGIYYRPEITSIEIRPTRWGSCDITTADKLYALTGIRFAKGITYLPKLNNFLVTTPVTQGSSSDSFFVQYITTITKGTGPNMMFDYESNCYISEYHGEPGIPEEIVIEWVMDVPSTSPINMSYVVVTNDGKLIINPVSKS